MRDRVYEDCPICGAKDSMNLKTNQSLEIESKQVGRFSVDQLSGYYCSVCGEGFLSIASRNRVQAVRARRLAELESERVPISKVLTIKTIVEKTGMAKQAISALIRSGKVPYVLDGDNRQRPTIATLEAVRKFVVVAGHQYKDPKARKTASQHSRRQPIEHPGQVLKGKGKTQAESGQKAGRKVAVAHHNLKSTKK